ncbi:MAG: CNNM domain-containing protein, partial [Alphaproteobacteria bacterium]
MDMESLLIIGTIVVLLFLSAMFSGSETALTAVSRARIHRRSQEGSGSARTVSGLIEDRERLIGAVLLGNNLVNILASTLAASLFLSLFGDIGVAYATLVMTVLVLIFAEVLPKTYAIINSERVALLVAPVIALTVRLFGPPVSAVQTIVRATLRLFGANIEAGRTVLSAHEELSEAIDLHHMEGGLVRRDRDM